MKIFKLNFSLVQHWNRKSIINVNEFYPLVRGQFPLFWLRYAETVLWPSTYLFIYFQQVIVGLSIFCCKYFLVVVVRNRFYLLTYLPNCHHQIIYCIFNLMIEYPPPYKCLVWDYGRADQNAIAKALDQVNWNFLFFNRNVDKQVNILNRTLMKLYTKEISYF